MILISIHLFFLLFTFRKFHRSDVVHGLALYVRFANLVDSADRLHLVPSDLFDLESPPSPLPRLEIVQMSSTYISEDMIRVFALCGRDSLRELNVYGSAGVHGTWSKISTLVTIYIYYHFIFLFLPYFIISSCFILFLSFISFR